MMHKRCGRMQARKDHQCIGEHFVNLLDGACERPVGDPGEGISDSPNSGRASPRAN